MISPVSSPAVPTAYYGQPGGPQGSGAVNIYNNLIQANMAEDDGGGLRFLMAGNFPMNVYNNMSRESNVSMHEGGGVAIDDGPNCAPSSNNTVMKQLRPDATAITSDGLPAPRVSRPANSGPAAGYLAMVDWLSQPTATAALQRYLFNNMARHQGYQYSHRRSPRLMPSPGIVGVVGFGGNLLTPTNQSYRSCSYPQVLRSGQTVLRSCGGFNPRLSLLSSSPPGVP